MSGGVTLDAATRRRIAEALRHAEMWTAKYIADNDHEHLEPGIPLQAAKQSLQRITKARAKLEVAPA